MHTQIYENSINTTSWQGLQLDDGDEFDKFIVNEVKPRLHDDAGKADFTTHLNSLASTGFAHDSLQAILEAEQQENRDWAVGENIERDKRTPQASLPGADLVGFVTRGSETRLALGEVKCSSDSNTPPNVMTGRHGMTRQLENLATDIGLLHTLIRWLQPRCRGNSAEPQFNAAISLLLQSGNKAISLFGVLVRDTQPDEKDVQNRSRHLGNIVKDPARCHLLALYLPCTITSLPARLLGSVK